MGSYGSGKTSVLKNYEAKHAGGNKYMFISLARFSDTKADESLELKIMKHIYYSLDSKSVRNSTLEGVREPSKRSVFSVLALLLLFCLALIVAFDPLSVMPEEVALFAKGAKFALLLLSMIFVLALAYLLLFRFERIPFQRIKVAALAEIEAKSKEPKGFDAHLDEILFLLSKAKSKIIVFEDLDRYSNAIDVFSGLREINYALNNRYASDSRIFKKAKTPYRFIYTLSSDLFEDGESRTKFFDLIIPIIPFADSANLYECARELFGNSISKDILETSSIHFDGMRLLKNIYNEYTIYRDKINAKGVENDQVFAAVVYKNLFAKDFKFFRQQKGYLFWLFSKDNKERFVSQSISDRQVELGELRSEMPEDDYLTECNILKHKKEVQSQRSLRDILDDAISSFDNETITAVFKPPSDHVNIYSIEAGVFLDDRNFDLVRYYVLNGHINEDFSYATSFFYAGSMTNEDRDFISAAKARRVLPSDYHLPTVDIVIEKLAVSYFINNQCCINESLMVGLLTCEPTFETKEKLMEIVKTASRSTDITPFYNVLSIEGIDNKYVLTDIISTNWTDLPNRCVASYESNKETFRSFVHLLLHYANAKTVHQFNETNPLQKWCDCDKEFLIGIEKVNNLSKKIDALAPIRFQIDDKHIDEGVFNLIYEKNAYRIDQITVECIIQIKYGVPLNHTKLCSIVLSRPSEPLCAYSINNLNELVELSISLNEHSIADDENTVATIINDGHVTEDSKNSYLHLCDTKLSNLRLIDDPAIYSTLITEDVVASNAFNVLEYFTYASEMTLDNTLQHLIMQADSFFNFPEITEDHNKEAVGKLFEKIINIDGLHWPGYEQLINSFGYVIPNIQQYGGAVHHLKELIESKIIEMNRDNYNSINYQYNSQLIEFCLSNIDDYIAVFSGSFAQEDKFNELLSIIAFLSYESLEEHLEVIWDEVSSLDKQKRMRFISAVVKQKKRQDTIEILRQTGQNAFVAILTTRKKPTFRFSDEEKIVLDCFKARNWISFTKLNDEKFRVNPRGI